MTQRFSVINTAMYADLYDAPGWLNARRKIHLVIPDEVLAKEFGIVLVGLTDHTINIVISELKLRSIIPTDSFITSVWQDISKETLNMLVYHPSYAQVSPAKASPVVRFVV